jgi:hypothetical protein
LPITSLALNAGWDSEVLAGEMQALIEIGFDVELTGFSLAEIDLTIAEAEESKPSGKDSNDDQIPPLRTTAVTCPGDVWLLGRHRLLCGDARESTSYATLMGDERAELMFTDPPYNVPIMGHVCGLGRTQHREFAMAAGEMTPTQFTGFLTSTLGNGTAYCADGAIAYVCMDWRHIAELSEAATLSSTSSKTSASGTRQMVAWALSTAQNTNSSSSSRLAMPLTSIRSVLAIPDGTEQMSGIIPV